MSELKKQYLVGGLDIESTGLDYKNGHRIIELALSIYDLETKERVVGVTKRFNPRRTIDTKAQAVHGISLEMLAAEPLFEDEAPALAELLTRCDYIVAHNGESFDGPFTKAEFRLAGITLPDLPIFDTMLEALWATEDGKRPRLQELAFALGYVYDSSKAHSALYDTDLMMQCFFTARERYGYFKLPHEVP